MNAIIDCGEAWPYPDGRTPADFRTSWRKIAERHAMQLRECLPPIDLAGRAFFVGEPASHDARGVAIHSCIARVDGAYYLRDLPMDGWREALAELRQAIAS